MWSHLSTAVPAAATTVTTAKTLGISGVTLTGDAIPQLLLHTPRHLLLYRTLPRWRIQCNIKQRRCHPIQLSFSSLDRSITSRHYLNKTLSWVKGQRCFSLFHNLSFQTTHKSPPHPYATTASIVTLATATTATKQPLPLLPTTQEETITTTTVPIQSTMTRRRRLSPETLSSCPETTLELQTIASRTAATAAAIGTLFKWKLSTWVTISTLPGFVMSVAVAPVGMSLVSPSLGCLILGTFLCSGGANSFNQLIEKSRDAKMVRTRFRPLPSGHVSEQFANRIAWGSSIAGITILSLGTNVITAGLGAATILLYTSVYTPLKVKTPYNTHIGAVVGSIPTIMGCSAAGVSLLMLDPWMLFTIQTLWQFPHFYGLAWRYREDYRRGGFVSFPLTDEKGHQTAAMMKPYVIATAALPFITTLALDITSAMFLVDGTAANAVLYYSFRQFEHNPTVTTSRNFFGMSLWHLLVLLTLSVFHSRWLFKSPDNSLPPETSRFRLEISVFRQMMHDFCMHDSIFPVIGPKGCVFLQIFREQVSKPSSTASVSVADTSTSPE